VAAVVGIERRFPHQAVHADLGLEPAVGVVARDPERSRLDARDFAVTGFQQFGLPAPIFGPAQVHPQQHFRPVLRLGAAGARLDVHEGIGRIHFTREHAPEFQLADARFQPVHVVRDGSDGGIVTFVGGQLQQLTGVVEPVGNAIQAFHEVGKACPLAAQILRALRIVPDLRVFQFASYFFEAFALDRVVKDTP